MACRNTVTSESDDEVRVPHQRIVSTKQLEMDKNCQEQYMKKLERENVALKKKNQKLATTSVLAMRTNQDLQEHADEEYRLLHNGREPPESEDEENEEPSTLFSSLPTTELLQHSSSPPRIDLATGRRWESRRPQLSHSAHSGSCAPSPSALTVPDSPPLPDIPLLPLPDSDLAQKSSSVPPRNDPPENSASSSHHSKCQRSLGPNDTKSDSKRTCTIARGEKGLNLRDYSGTAKSVIHEVLQRYENKIFTVDAYPDDTKQAEIVHSLWADVCENVGKEFELTAALQSMIKKQGARACGNVRDRIQPMVSPMYGFQVSDKKKIQQTNKNLYVMLSTGSAFSFKKPEEKFRQFENKIIFRAICVCWFKNQKAPRIRYSDDYDLIKPESLALVMTILENCIEEWSSGKYVPRPLDEDIQCPRYLAHLADVKKWCEDNMKVTENIRRRWHDCARSNSGAKAKEKVTGYLNDEEEENRAKADLDGRTGEMDSEDEPDEDDEENQMEILDE
ncbi:uncharacterized protein EV420DRAFT_1639791 [Desarmillaria tabescens]|uniref:DUF6532 domain-containing protein n=1 Tax=Armillaria tabescens TaxID=1929756 RepID=A0AA39TST6_ARMTA|nr:uncharacterized protein EV420DRAFT_1639791 [Desarmillaria tabescens]KAK0462569.1 hypothetical protein EV420DRAFT_1639791 [Desarmillaria tabescens]